MTILGYLNLSLVINTEIQSLGFPLKASNIFNVPMVFDFQVELDFHMIPTIGGAK